MAIPIEKAAAITIDFHQSVDLAAIGIAHITLDGCFLHANSRFCSQLGYARDELASRCLPDIVHRDDREAMHEGLMLMLNGVEEDFSFEQRFLHRNGHAFWTHTRVALARDARGEAQYFVATVEDIEKTRRAERALLERKAILRATFEQAAIGIAQVDPAGYFMRVNRKFVDIVGYSEEELLRMRFAELPCPEDSCIGIAEFQQAIAGEIATFTVEKRYLRRDGQIRWVRVTGSAVHDADTSATKFIVAVIEDISEKKLPRKPCARARRAFGCWWSTPRRPCGKPRPTARCEPILHPGAPTPDKRRKNGLPMAGSMPCIPKTGCVPKTNGAGRSGKSARWTVNSGCAARSPGRAGPTSGLPRCMPRMVQSGNGWA